MVEDCRGAVCEHVPLPAPPGELIHFEDVVGAVAGVGYYRLAGRVEIFPTVFGEPAFFFRAVVEIGAGVGGGDGELYGVCVEADGVFDGAQGFFAGLAGEAEEEVCVGLDAEGAAVSAS